MAPLIQLSQSHLKLLSLCPRKYQYTYLDQLLVPTVSSQAQEQAELGQQFHRIMQQYWMGLNVTPLLEQSPHLKNRFQAFQAHPPPYIEGHRVTEYQQRVKLGNALLVGIFDLLAMNETQGQIIDWKSYSKPKSSIPLLNSWQTKLYPYLLTESSALQPDQISMTYWFAKTQDPTDSHHLTFPYSQSLHAQTHQEIIALLQKLDHWLKAYTQKEALPQVNLNQGHCLSDPYPCPYLYRCERSPDHKPDDQSPHTISLTDALNLDSIPEVQL